MEMENRGGDPSREKPKEEASEKGGKVNVFCLTALVFQLVEILASGYLPNAPTFQNQIPRRGYLVWVLQKKKSAVDKFHAGDELNDVLKFSESVTGCIIL